MVAKFFIFLTEYFFIAVFDPSQYDKQDPPRKCVQCADTTELPCGMLTLSAAEQHA